MVRDYYRTEMRNRLNRMRRPDAPAWQPGGARGRSAGPEIPQPAPFAAGSAARRSGAESRRLPPGAGAAGRPDRAAGPAPCPGRGPGGAADRQSRPGPAAQRPAGRPVADPARASIRPRTRPGEAIRRTSLEAQLIEEHLAADRPRAPGGRRPDQGPGGLPRRPGRCRRLGRTVAPGRPPYEPAHGRSRRS